MTEEATAALPPNSSSRASDQVFRKRAAMDAEKSRNRSPPSRGTRGNALESPSRRLIHAIQYSTFAPIQKVLGSTWANGPVRWKYSRDEPPTGSSVARGRTIQSTLPTRGPFGLPSGHTRVCLRAGGVRKAGRTPRNPRVATLGFLVRLVDAVTECPSEAE